MTTGVQDYYDKRWVLRAIKKEQGLTPAGENVKVDIDKLTNRDPDAPAVDDVRKYIKFFASEGVFRVEKKYIDDPSEVYDPPDATWERATNFELAINQELFDAVCGGFENPVGPIDLKSNDAVCFKEEKAKIGAIKHSEDHKIELNKWLEVKNILDAIHRQLSPMGGHNQAVNLVLKKTHKNISESVLDDLWRRGICGYGGGARTMDEERFHYLRGSLIEVRDINRFNEYRNGVSDFVKWIEQDSARFSKTDPETEDEEKDDCFSYDGGISTPYANTDLELFVLKKILLEHKQRDDAGFHAKELSFNNDSLEYICRPIELMIEDKILYLSANTHPERSEHDASKGIEDERGFINWGLVEKLDKNPSEIDAIGGIVFDTDMQDELKLKGRIDIAVEEFMNDRVQNPFGFAYMMDKTRLNDLLARNEQEPDKDKKEWVKKELGSEESAYPYSKQRELIIDELLRGSEDEIVMPLNSFRDEHVDVLKTLLALEKENLLRIKGLESNAMYDKAGNFVGLWATKDNPTAKLHILKMQASITAKPRTNSGKNVPLTSEEKGEGYFQLNKHGAKIPIGGIGTRPFRLLRRLCDPFGVPQNVEEVFGSIKLSKDDRDPLLREWIPEKRSRMVHIIRISCNKELQKKLQGKIKFCFDAQETKMWIELLD